MSCAGMVCGACAVYTSSLVTLSCCVPLCLWRLTGLRCPATLAAVPYCVDFYLVSQYNVLCRFRAFA